VVAQAVHGLGGIGKSALAAHWAATRPHGHAPVRWINADSFAAVQQGLADLATALQPALAQALTAEALADRAAQWLATHAGWLLVLDNVNDPADIAGLLGRATTGRFLNGCVGLGVLGGVSAQQDSRYGQHRASSAVQQRHDHRDSVSATTDNHGNHCSPAAMTLRAPQPPAPCPGEDGEGKIQIPGL
jgi:hypothetical protein